MIPIFIQKYQNKVTRSLIMCLLILLLFNLGCTKKRTYDLQEQLDQNVPLGEILEGHPKERLYGKYYQGGLIYYIYEGQTKYCLIATQKPIANEAIWAESGTILADTDYDYYGSGIQNTKDILNACSAPGIAADLCDKLELNGYSDWHLPTLTDLAQINFLFHHENDFPFMYIEDEYHWSSNWVVGTSSIKPLVLRFTNDGKIYSGSFASYGAVIAARMITF